MTKSELIASLDGIPDDAHVVVVIAFDDGEEYDVSADTVELASDENAVFIIGNTSGF